MSGPLFSPKIPTCPSVRGREDLLRLPKGAVGWSMLKSTAGLERNSLFECILLL